MKPHIEAQWTRKERHQKQRKHIKAQAKAIVDHWNRDTTQGCCAGLGAGNLDDWGIYVAETQDGRHNAKNGGASA